MAPFEGFSAKDVRGANERAAEEAAVITGHHSEDLYDQNEDAAGEGTDLATGKRFVNDNDSVEAVRDRLRSVEHGSHDALPDLKEEDDDAARWLRENGG